MSELGNLSQCMVDGDQAAKTRASRLRRRALAVSVVLEAVVIGGVMLWPLATLGVLPPQVTVTPLPPFHGPREPQQAAQQPPHVIHDHLPTFTTVLRQPVSIPTHVDTGPEPPSIGEPNGPTVPGISEGFSDGRPIEIAPPVPPQPQTKTMRRGQEVMEAMLVHRVEPDYPRIAQRIRLSGTVVLRAKIGTDGEVHELETLSGHPILADAARKAVLQWRYRPTMLNGQAVEVETQITVTFIFNQ
jgi:periplasmic protein TonB